MTGFIVAAMIIGLCQSLGKHFQKPVSEPEYPNLITYLFFYDVNNE
jgi:hypothetical protein